MEQLGRYEIRGELGKGGMGVVYRAFDPTLEREVAIKSVRLDGIDEAARAQLEERLSREARAAARLQHPNIVAVHDFFRIEDRAYIVMELVRGSMLDAMIAAGNRQNVAGILKVLRQAASALDAAHAQGIIHRDIKPGNILIDETGNVKITDFGIARMTTPGATETMSQGFGSTVGTLGYMAPEQIRGEAVDGRADQFSLGIVAYQLFSGEMPFMADTWIALSYKIIHDPPPAIGTSNPAVSAGMEKTLQRAIAKQPADRFASCSEFIQNLEHTGAQSATTKSFNWMLPVAAAAALAGGYFFLKPAAPPAPVEQKPPVASTPAPPPPPVQTPVAPPPPAAPVGWGDFVTLPAGTFHMGSDTDERDQRPRHLVQLTKPFDMMKTEVSEQMWNEVMTGKATGSKRPKVKVSWQNTQAFMAKLNARGDGYHYRLPTEAEWEYAARGTNQYDTAWYWDSSGGRTHDVGEKAPNPQGLYDMLGNVWEWTGDWFDEEYFGNSPKVNPTGAASGKAKIYRGGAFDTQLMMLTPTFRFGDPPDHTGEDLGFRVVRTRKN